jgi:hypothetical protein
MKKKKKRRYRDRGVSYPMLQVERGLRIDLG